MFLSSAVGGVNADHKGRFSHVAVAAFGNTLLISGGYKGSMLGDLVAYTVPTAVARNKVSWGQNQSYFLIFL